MNTVTTRTYMDSNTLAILEDYCSKGDDENNTNRIVRQPNLNYRICWATLFSVSLYLCVTLIIAMYKKWELTITGEIVSFAQKPTPVWEIPFPAVTICPQTKSRQTKFNFTKAFHQIKAGNISEDE